jgi:hypothetical protein
MSEQEAWRLFQQILEALVYMSSLGIAHLSNLSVELRLTSGPPSDIKLTNVFMIIGEPYSEID